ncbi:MAG: O-antigen ligase family protein [Planctomycetes bacterium]|nr:O-antigen ligase family protein [Planctomycetota bacterium]
MPEKLVRTRLATAAVLAALAVPSLAIGPHWLRPEQTKAQLLLVLGGIALLIGLRAARAELGRFSLVQRTLLFAPLAVALLSGFFAERLVPAFALSAQGAAALSVLLLVASAPRTLREHVLTGAIATGSMVAAIGWLERAGFSLGLSSASAPSEPVSTFGNVAFASELVLPCAFLALRSALRARTRPRALGYAALHLLQASYLALADTLTAAIAYQLVAVASLAVLYVRQRAHARALAPVLIAGLACFHLPLAAPFPSAPHAASESASPSELGASSGRGPRDFRTLDVRLLTWRAILTDVFPSAPWLGLGAGSFDELYPPFRSAEERALSRRAEGGTVVNTAHNDALQALAETGLLGALALGAALAVLLLATRRGTATERTFLFAALVAVLLNGGARTPLLANAPVAALFAALLGALVARSSRAADAAAGHGPLLPILLLAGFTTAGAIFGGTRLVASLEVAQVIAALPAAGAAIDEATRERLGAELDTALVLAPEDYRARLLRARLATDGAQALRAVERAQVDAPHDLAALALEAELAFRSASLLPDPQPALRRSLAANQRRLALDPDDERARANALLAEVYLARASANTARAFELYRELVSLRPALRAELAPLFADLRQRAAREALAAKRYDEAARWLAEEAAAQGDESALLAEVERLAREGELSGARALAAVCIPGPDRRQRYDELSSLLAQRALDAWNLGNGPALKEALEAAVALAVDRAARELELGKEWMKRSLGASGEQSKLASFYGRKLTLDGHESSFLAALRRSDLAAAESSLARLGFYSEYRELAIAPLDRAALAFAHGRTAEARELAQSALDAGLKTLGARRDALYRQLFASEPFLRERLEQLAR